MTNQPQSYHGYRFPPEIISHAVWLYHRFCLSFRDAEDLLAQRGITVTYETIRQWCQTFGLDYAGLGLGELRIPEDGDPSGWIRRAGTAFFLAISQEETGTVLATVRPS